MVNEIKKVIKLFWKNHGEAIKEALYTALRQMLFIVVSGFVSTLIAYFTATEQTQTTVTLLVILNFVDKWIHENWKAKGKTGLRGISPF